LSDSRRDNVLFFGPVVKDAGRILRAVRRTACRVVSVVVAWRIPPWLQPFAPALLALATAGEVAASSLEAYGQLPAISEVAITPKGTRIAYLSTRKDGPVLLVMEVAGQHQVSTFPVGKSKVRQLLWADERHLVVDATLAKTEPYLVATKIEWSFLRVLDIDTGKTVALPDQLRLSHELQGKDVMNVAGSVQVRRIDGHPVLFAEAVYQEEHYWRPALFRFDLETGEQKLVQKSQRTLLFENWLLDENGLVVGESAYDKVAHHYNLRALVGGRMDLVAEGDAEIEIPGYEGIGADGTTLIANFFENGDWVQRPISRESGKIGDAMPPAGPLTQRVFDPWTNRLAGWTETVDDVRRHFLDPKRERRWRSIEAAYQGARVRLVSATDDFSRLVVLVESPGEAYRYDFVDMSVKTTYVIGDVYDGIDPPLATRRVEYAARDGLSVPAYLTLPAGRPPNGLALVVLVHGGPAARDTADFDWMAQALAREGYAVLRPNYRGSDLGRRFLEAGFGEWGRKMQTDLSDGVRHLVTEGIVDPARVCVVGSSYGGYAALAAMTLDPGPWRCAVSIAGLSDLVDEIHWIDKSHAPADDGARQYWMRYFGVKDEDDPILEAISPARHVGAATPPVLLVHGEDDTVVRIQQSRIMEAAMRKARRPVEFVLLQGEDHWLSRSETRAQALTATAEFLRRTNPPDPPAATR